MGTGAAPPAYLGRSLAMLSAMRHLVRAITAKKRTPFGAPRWRLPVSILIFLISVALI